MAIIALADYSASKPDAIALPNYTDLGVTSVKNLKISFDNIHIDDEGGNNQKVETHTAQELEQLRLSFANGVDTTEFPPAVYDRGSDHAKRYVLVYGYGRTDAIRALGQKDWIFTLLVGTPSQMEDVQARENEGYPKRLNKEVDMRHHLSRKVSDGRIPNTEDAIRKEFTRIYGRTRDASCKGRVLNMVMEEVGTPQPYRLFPSPVRVQEWVENHASTEHVVGGEYNEDSDTYGVCIGEGYQYRVIMQAVQRYMETGKYTDLIGHVKAPTAKLPLELKRKKFMQQLNQHKAALEHCGLKVFPLRVLGFLPQDRATENVKELVKVA